MGLKRNPGWMQREGDEVLSRAKTVGTGAVKAQLARFSPAHRAFLAAMGRTDVAKSAELDRRLARGELDARLDASVDVLATRLAGDGFARLRPFKTFGAPAPKELQQLGDEKQANACLTLAAAVQRSKDTSAASKKAAKALAANAKASLAASKAIAPVAAETASRRKQRDALNGEWAKSYALLKLASKLSEAAGGEPLYSTLFGRPARAPKKPTPSPAPPEPP